MVNVKYELADGTVVNTQTEAKASGQLYKQVMIETQMARPVGAPAEVGPLEQFIRDSEYTKKSGQMVRGVVALYDEETIKEVYAKQKEWAIESARWNTSSGTPVAVENAIKAAAEVTERNLAFMLLAHKAMTDDDAFEELMIKLEQQSRDIAQKRADDINVSAHKNPSDAAGLRNMYFDKIDEDVERYKQYWLKIREMAT